MPYRDNIKATRHAQCEFKFFYIMKYRHHEFVLYMIMAAIKKPDTNIHFREVGTVGISLDPATSKCGQACTKAIILKRRISTEETDGYFCEWEPKFFQLLVLKTGIDRIIGMADGSNCQDGNHVTLIVMTFWYPGERLNEVY